MSPATRRDVRSSPARRLQRRLCPLALAAASLFALAPAGAAGPALPVAAPGALLQGGLNVVQGRASATVNGNRLTVTNSAGTLLDWQRFDIGAGAAVHFAQPSAESKVLNRVLGNDPSRILGSLSSNGQVWLQNPNGVLFGPGARIDVAALVATTLAIDSAAWQDGLRSGSFRLGDAAAPAFGGIVNQGELRSASGGRVLLVGGAGGVRNEGLIHAPDGQVLLAAGAQVDLVDSSLPRLGLRLQAPQGDVLNLGRVLAGNGRIDLQAAVVNQQGIVRADAIGAGGVVLASASEALTLGAGSITSASGGSGGRVALDAGSGALLASGRIDATASAGTGGQVSLLGRQVGLLDGGAIDASGAAGGGAVRLGGGLRGQDAAYRNADATFMARGASIRADATGQGDGGLVVLWGSQAMRAYGTLSARGGAGGGDGGLIETSGHWIDARPLAIDTKAPAGRTGQWLIDPYDILITDTTDPDTNVSGGPDFTSTGSPSWLTTTTLAAALDAGNDVNVTTGPGGTGFGDILVSGANLLVAPPNAVTLTLSALGNIEFSSATVRSSAAPLTVRLLAGVAGGQLGGNDSNTSGGGIHLVGANIATAGGGILLGGPTVACGPTLGCNGNAGAVVGSPSRLTNAIELLASNLDAGAGSVVMQGHSIVGFTNSAGVQLASSTVRGRTIDIRGTVDADGQNSRFGVLLNRSQLTATDALNVTGAAYAPTEPTTSVLTGVHMNNGTELTTVGVGSTMSVDGRVTAGTGNGQGGALLIGLDLSDDGTRLVAGPGGAIDLVGQASGNGLRVGISTFSTGSPMVDASAGSRLTLNSDNQLFLNASMVAPTGGTLLLRGDEGLFIDDMQLTGAPAAALLRGSIVAIGAQGLATAVSFDGFTTVGVQAGQFLLGGSDTGDAESQPADVRGRPRALAFAPPGDAQALLAAGGGVRIQADVVQLVPGGVVYSSNEGTAIDIAGRSAGTPVLSFVNDAGSAALQAPSGRWLVHGADSPDAGSFLPGGLRADFWQYADIPGTTAPAQGGNGFLFASTPVLSLLADGGPSKVYDGSTVADLGNATLGGLRAGHALVGAPRFADADAGSAKPLALATALGGYSVINSDDTPVYGYAVDAATMRGSITPRPVTLLAATAQDKVYDGSTAATIGQYSLGAVVAGDALLANVAGQFDSAGVGAGKNVAARITGLSGADAANYVASGAPLSTTASITPRSLGLQSATVADKVYDGGTTATVSNWVLSNVVAGDQVQVSAGSAVFGSAGAGIGKPVTATVTALGGNAAANYRAEGASTQTTGNITPRPLTASGLTVADKVYDGSTVATITGWVLSNVVGEDDVRISGATARFSSADVGEAKPVTATASGLTGAAAGNYTVGALSAQTTASITPASQPLVQPPEQPVPGTVSTSIATAVVAVLAPTVASSPASGRALDAVPVLTQASATGGEAGARRFDSLDLDRMSAGAVAMALAAREAYKSEVFKSAKDELAANPAVADAPGCASQQQAASGQCLMVRPTGNALDISNARVVERAPVTAPGLALPPPPAPAPAAAVPAPARPAAAATAAPGAPAVPAAPAAPAPRIQPLPPDLAVNLPPRQPVARAAVPQIQRKIAVLIGIDRYQDERIPQLGNAVADARAVARTLTERLGYETLVLENPGKATIFRTLNQLAGQVGPNDSVVLYYAGHGERIEKTGLGYWQPADADAGRAESWISNADIDRLLRQLPASQLAMVSDSCFSGSLVSGERIRGVPATPDPATLLNKRAVVVMTSGGNEPVFDSGLNGHSPFAWNLMQSLNQVGNQAIGWKPGSSVFEQVRFAVARKLPQRPQYGASSGGGHEAGADYLFEQRQLR